MMTNDIQEVLNDRQASDWLKWALRSGLKRDPVDAANDTEILFQLLSDRCEMILHDESRAFCEAEKTF